MIKMTKGGENNCKNSQYQDLKLRVHVQHIPLGGEWEITVCTNTNHGTSLYTRLIIATLEESLLLSWHSKN